MTPTLKFKSWQVNAPDYRMFVPQTGVWIRGNTMNQYVANLRRHFDANNLPIGLLWREQAEHEACLNVGPEWCISAQEVRRPPHIEITWESVKKATSTLISWAVGGSVSEEETEARAVTCMRCPHNIQGSVCAPCVAGKFLSLINDFIGKYKSRHASKLGICAICGGCSLEVKTRIKKEDILRHESPEVVAFYPDFCWLK